MTEPRAYCSDLARESGEPFLGTAPRVDVWLMIEYTPVWQSRALEDNSLHAAVLGWIDDAVAAFDAQGLGARPQFIRQRRAANGSAIRLLIARQGRLFRAEVEHHDALCGLDVTSDGLEIVSDTHYFVCTNGRRDLCCARYGLPVYKRLAERVADRAWETTHLGGHRFAPNVLVLPQSTVYAHVLTDRVDEFVDAVEAGELAVPFLRGRSRYPPEAQVAETRVSGQIEALVGVEGGAVTFRTSSGLQTVTVRRAGEPIEIVPSCGADPENVYPFEVAG